MGLYKIFLVILFVYYYNTNGNPFYHFENCPSASFDGLVDDGIRLFEDLYKSKAMASAGMHGPTPIVSLDYHYSWISNVRRTHYNVGTKYEG